MEKRETGKTITIKINGKKQSYGDDSKQNQNQKFDYIIEPKKEELDQKLTPQLVITKQEPEPKSIKVSLNLEENVTKTEAAATKEPIEDHFDWILPEPEEMSEKQPISEFNKPASASPKMKKTTPKPFLFGKSKKRGFFTTIFTAVFLAVLLGTSLGLTILKLVIVEKKPAQEVISNNPETTINPSDKSEATKSGAISLALPTISTFVVQGGVFSTKEAGKKIEAEIKQKQVPALIIENKGQYVLLLSVTDSIENTRELTSKYKQSGVDTSYLYPKELALGGIEVSNVNQQEKAYLEAFPLLFETMTKATSTVTFTATIPPSLIESINQQVKKMNESAGTSLENEKIVSLKKNIDLTTKGVIALGKSATPKEITTVQQQLLSLLAGYQTLG